MESLLLRRQCQRNIKSFSKRCNFQCIFMFNITASIHSAATPLGSLLSGVFMDNCGRKLTLQIASLPVIVGWTMIAFSRSHIVLLLGRLIAGISVGLTAAAGQVMLLEHLLVKTPKQHGFYLLKESVCSHLGFQDALFPVRLLLLKAHILVFQ